MIPKVAPSKIPAAEILRILVPIIVIVLIYFIGKKFFKSIIDGIKSPFEEIGLADTKEEKAAIAKKEKNVKQLEDMGVNNPFNPSYLADKQKKHDIALITSASAKSIAKQIYDSIGLVYDTPEQTLAAIKRCANKCQVSFVAKVFSETYKVDLLQFLQSKLDTTEQQVVLGKIINYVNALNIGKK